MFNFYKTATTYLDFWPDVPALYAIYKEYRIRQSLKFLKIVIPPFIAFLLLWNFYQGGGLQGVAWWYALTFNLHVTFICIAVLFLLLLQGYYWAYSKSQQKVNQKEVNFVNELNEKFDLPKVTGCTYFEYASLLQKAFNKFGADVFANI